MNLISIWLVLLFPVFGVSIDDHGKSFGEERMSVQVDGPLLQVGEELEYSVHYSFFTIGTIKFRVISKEMKGDRPVYRAATIIDSNPSLGWLLSVNIRFYGLMDSTIYSHTWLSDDSTSDGVAFRSMVFDYSANNMYYTKGDRSNAGVTAVTDNDTITVEGPSQDGMSLFFFAREHVRSKWTVDVPTYMDTTQASTRIRFTGERKPVEISAVSYPVETMYLDGKADFVGVFGVTGEYEGWFSNDAARIPIMAKMKVLLGSVKIELENWNRKGWNPPKYGK